MPKDNFEGRGLCHISTPQLRVLDTPARVFAIFEKGDNFGDFLFALLLTKSLMKKGLL